MKVNKVLHRELDRKEVYDVVQERGGVSRENDVIQLKK